MSEHGVPMRDRCSVRPQNTPSQSPVPKPKRRRGLSPRGQAFCLAYLANGNATQAVEDAGFLPGGNRETKCDYGKKLLKRPCVQEALAAYRLIAALDAQQVGGKILATFGLMDPRDKRFPAIAKLAAEVTGALKPRKHEVEHSGGVTLEQLVPKRKSPAEGSK